MDPFSSPWVVSNLGYGNGGTSSKSERPNNRILQGVSVNLRKYHRFSDFRK